MKNIPILFLLLLIWSCNVDCSNVKCVSDSPPYPLFTIVDKSENLLKSKKIDITAIKAVNLDASVPQELKIDVFNPLQDTSFRINFNENHNTIRIKWPTDSIDLNVDYKLIESNCCPDVTGIQQVSNNGNALVHSGAVFVIKK